MAASDGATPPSEMPEVWYDGPDHEPYSSLPAPPSATLRQVGWIDRNGWLHPLTKAAPEAGWVSVYVIENAPCGRCGKGDSGDHGWDCLDGKRP